MSLIQQLYPIKSIFIIASPRSGTTWISKGLNVHPQIYCTERRLFGNYADFVLDEGADKPRLRCTLDKFVEASLLPQNFDKKESVLRSYIKALIKEEVKFSKRHVLVDKITPYVHSSNAVLKGIKTFFPKSKLVFLLRDGRDVCTSGVFHWFNKQLNTTTLSEFQKTRRAIFLKTTEKKINRFFTDEEIEEWACTWAEPLRLIDEVEQLFPVLIIRFEDMLQDQFTVFQTLYDFMGVKSDNKTITACVESSSFEKMAGRKRGEEIANAHVRKGISGDWLNYFTKKDGALFHQFAGDMLLKYNFVTSNDWYQSLPEKLV